MSFRPLTLLRLLFTLTPASSDSSSCVLVELLLIDSDLEFLTWMRIISDELEDSDEFDGDPMGRKNSTGSSRAGIVNQLNAHFRVFWNFSWNSFARYKILLFSIAMETFMCMIYFQQRRLVTTKCFMNKIEENSTWYPMEKLFNVDECFIDMRSCTVIDLLASRNSLAEAACENLTQRKASGKVHEKSVRTTNYQRIIKLATTKMHTSWSNAQTFRDDSIL